MHLTPRSRWLEIDEEADLALAEALLARRAATSSAPTLPGRIGAVVFDFDGVFTDNKVLVFADLQEAVLCDRADGLGIELLRTHGVPTLILSREVHPVVRARATKLELDILHGIREKVPILDTWLAERGIDWAAVVYVGNDVNDLECIRRAGCGVAVADAHPQVRAAADLVLSRRGGDGAVRELCEMILEQGRR